ncbi:hypothetical protein INR49_027492 [Caranx melampygus]|nr:hypothetical protein INR49_027492 [Caranx melampygus]
MTRTHSSHVSLGSTVPAQTPPSRTTPTEPRNYGSYNSQTAVNATTAELLRKQEELEKKARELERRERELESHSLGPGASRQNNWPPLPSFCPVGPCFYQDINVEISQQFQRTVTIMYYFWMFSTCTMAFNLISSMAMFFVDPKSGVGLGLAILWGLLFTPCSFVCWYRPVYKAFRSDSSFNFFVFFFVFFAQVVVYVIMTIGIPGWGFSGWIVSLSALNSSVPVGAIMMINAILFTAQTAMGVVLLKKALRCTVKMAEAAEEPQHRFFCHCCKCETNPKLPDFICPRCDSGFIEEVAEDSSLLQSSTSAANEDSNSLFPELWQLLFMERSALLSHPPSSESQSEDSEQVSTSQSQSPPESPVAAEAREPESSSRPEQEPSSRPEQRPAVEGIVQQFLAGLFANSGNPGVAPAALSSMLQLYSSPGDYAWVREVWMLLSQSCWDSWKAQVHHLQKRR